LQIGDVVANFYGSKKPFNIVLAGLNINPTTSGSYEVDLDTIIAGTDIGKIGLTLSTHMTAQRPDVSTLLGDLMKTEVNGVLFLPRPIRWTQWV